MNNNLVYVHCTQYSTIFLYDCYYLHHNVVTHIFTFNMTELEKKGETFCIAFSGRNGYLKELSYIEET